MENVLGSMGSSFDHGALLGAAALIKNLQRNEDLNYSESGFNWRTELQSQCMFYLFTCRWAHLDTLKLVIWFPFLQSYRETLNLLSLGVSSVNSVYFHFSF